MAYFEYPQWSQPPSFAKEFGFALARSLSWLDHCPMHQKVVGLIPGQDTYLGCPCHPRLGHIVEAAD